MPKITQFNEIIKYCRVCSCELIIGFNCTKYRLIHQQYICKNCNNRINNELQRNNPEKANRACHKWKENNRIKVRGYDNNWKNKNPKKLKDAWTKSSAKRRNLGDIQLFDNPFGKSIQVHKHHISSEFTLYIPASLHNNHLHGKYTQLHREELKPYIEGIYDISYIII